MKKDIIIFLFLFAAILAVSINFLIHITNQAEISELEYREVYILCMQDQEYKKAAIKSMYDGKITYEEYNNISAINKVNNKRVLEHLLQEK